MIYISFVPPVCGKLALLRVRAKTEPKSDRKTTICSLLHYDTAVNPLSLEHIANHIALSNVSPGRVRSHHAIPRRRRHIDELRVHLPLGELGPLESPVESLVADAGIRHLEVDVVEGHLDIALFAVALVFRDRRRNHQRFATSQSDFDGWEDILQDGRGDGAGVFLLRGSKARRVSRIGRDDGNVEAAKRSLDKNRGAVEARLREENVLDEGGLEGLFVGRTEAATEGSKGEEETAGPGFTLEKRRQNPAGQHAFGDKLEVMAFIGMVKCLNVGSWDRHEAGHLEGWDSARKNGLAEIGADDRMDC